MFYFEYDKKGYLIKYIESFYINGDFEKKFIMLHCTINENSITKFCEDGKYKDYIEYEEPIKLIQFFDLGESWTRTLLRTETHHPENKSITFPRIKKQINLENNKVYNLNIKLENSKVSNWKSLILN